MFLSLGTWGGSSLAAGRGRGPDQVGQLSHGVVDVDDRASRHAAAEEQARQLRDQYGLDVSLDGPRAVGLVRRSKA